MPHKLLIAKFNAYGLEDLSIQLVTSYLILSRGYLKDLYIFFINDMFYSIKKAELVNYIDDTVTIVQPTQKRVVDLLQAESLNQMLANPEKIQAIFINYVEYDI